MKTAVVRNLNKENQLGEAVYWAEHFKIRKHLLPPKVREEIGNKDLSRMKNNRIEVSSKHLIKNVKSFWFMTMKDAIK